MLLTLKLEKADIDTLLTLLQDATTRGRNRGEYTAHYSLIYGRIVGQQEAQTCHEKKTN